MWHKSAGSFVKLSAVFIVLGASLVFATGCASLAESMAMRPYDEALREDRMSPTEHARKRDEIRQSVTDIKR